MACIENEGLSYACKITSVGQSIVSQKCHHTVDQGNFRVGTFSCFKHIGVGAGEAGD